jgi:hypothetical protein
MNKKALLWVAFGVLIVAWVATLAGITIYSDYHPTPQKQAEARVERLNDMSDNLPKTFIFVEDRGHGYSLYRDDFGFYLVYRDEYYAKSMHIVFLGKAR